ncbi:hypothetical protein IU448_19380 [Nocardia flavorosea]|uniref:hypothetical protein n=1 Tax=Nocardia flavorosea TaxID=53429 RepID=UPI0018944887|nr:hypothetical protein [Nocardia flavorosea]MBF6351159.1 hypothetical protein [Nocardia flavorosea]
MNNPVTRAEEAIGRLRAVAAASDGKVRLGPGTPDDVIDTWPVPVPSDIRLLAREIGAISFDDHAPVTFGHPENTETRCCRAGAPATWWALHDNAAAETYFADIDSETGAWGPVFCHWEDNTCTLVAPSVSDWFAALAEGLDLSLRVAGGEQVEDLVLDLDDDDRYDLDFETVFRDWWTNTAEILLPRDESTATTLDALSARRCSDTELAAAAATLPDEALIADLRAPQYPTFIPFDALPGGSAHYRRFGGGTFIAAVPADS